MIMMVGWCRARQSQRHLPDPGPQQQAQHQGQHQGDNDANDNDANDKHQGRHQELGPRRVRTPRLPQVQQH